MLNFSNLFFNKNYLGLHHENIKMEATIGRLLNHSNIIQVYGLTRRNQNLAIVMEWADQGTLRSKLQDLTTSEKSQVIIISIFSSLLIFTNETS